jgi:adenylate kinase
MLRHEREIGSEIGLKAHALTSKGQLAPNDLVMRLVENWLEDKTDGFLFDGFPRTLSQAAALETLLAERNAPLECALLLDISYEVISDRILRRLVCKACRRPVSLGTHVQSKEEPCPYCGGQLEKRADDSLEVLDKRMAIHREATVPVIEFYRSTGLLAEIDASAESDAVLAQITQVLEVA